MTCRWFDYFLCFLASAAGWRARVRLCPVPAGVLAQRALLLAAVLALRDQSVTGSCANALNSNAYAKATVSCMLAGERIINVFIASCKTLASKTRNATCSRLSIVRFANGPKRSMGHVLGAKKGIFLIRGRGRPTVHGGRASGILSIPAEEVSLGSPRVGTIHVQAPTPHAPSVQAFLADFSQQTTGFSHL